MQGLGEVVLRAEHGTVVGGGAPKTAIQAPSVRGPQASNTSPPGRLLKGAALRRSVRSGPADRPSDCV